MGPRAIQEFQMEGKHASKAPANQTHAYQVQYEMVRGFLLKIETKSASDRRETIKH